MKKILTILALAFIAQSLFAQNETPFVPVGATWTYSYLSYGMTSPPGTITINKSICKKDTVILGKKCSQIHCDYSGCSYFGTQLFMYKEHNKVFAFRNGEFFLIYDFNKSNVGDSWETSFATQGTTKTKFTFETQKVDSVTVFNGKKVRRFTLNMSRDLPNIKMKNIEIYENIGSNIHILPQILVYPACDDFNGYTEGIRCYEDKNVGKLQFTDKNCEDKTIINTYEFESDKLISIFPNPAQSEFFIKLEVNIFNQQGEKILSQNILQNTDNQHIELYNLPNGLYFWEIKFDDKRAKNGKILILK